MHLRAARETDIPGIRDVANRSLAASYDDVLDTESRQMAVESWYGTEESSPGTIAEELADEDTIVIVAEDDGEIVGFVQAFVAGDSPRVGQIEWLHVRPDRRSEGTADQLLDRIETALHDAGAERIEARVIEANQAGVEFYEGYGYDPTNTRHVRLAGDRVVELTLVGERGGTPATHDGLDRGQTEDGRTVFIATDESERGSEGPFHPTYLDEERTEHYGWYCSVCGSLDVSVGTMDEFVCDNCGNRRRAMRWDAVYGG